MNFMKVLHKNATPICRAYSNSTLTKMTVSTSTSKTRRVILSIFGASTTLFLCQTYLSNSTECEINMPMVRNFVGDVVAGVSPAVVNIICANEGRGYNGISTGSGFVVSKDGFVATNSHVVENAVDNRVLITMKDGKKYHGHVHSKDPQSDIAVLKFDIKPHNLPVAKLGSSGKLRAGDFVVSIGSPMSLQNSASFGIVSALARHATELGLTNNRSEYIQTDAACNRGNSGGPLVNMDGEVVGINTMVVQGSEGLAFAIPMDIASLILSQLMAKGRVDRPYVGLKMIPVDPAPDPKPKDPRKVDIFNIRPTVIMVLEVIPGSPAEKAGLKKHDVITEVDGRPISQVRDVLECIRLEIGQTLTMKILRPTEDRSGVLKETPLTVKLVTTLQPVEKVSVGVR